MIFFLCLGNTMESILLWATIKSLLSVLSDYSMIDSNLKYHDDDNYMKQLSKIIIHKLFYRKRKTAPKTVMQRSSSEGKNSYQFGISSTVAKVIIFK